MECKVSPGYFLSVSLSLCRPLSLRRRPSFPAAGSAAVRPLERRALARRRLAGGGDAGQVGCRGQPDGGPGHEGVRQSRPEGALEIGRFWLRRFLPCRSLQWFAFADDVIVAWFVHGSASLSLCAERGRKQASFCLHGIHHMPPFTTTMHQFGKTWYAVFIGDLWRKMVVPNPHLPRLLKSESCRISKMWDVSRLGSRAQLLL